jgi:hypothetical protein
MKSAGILGKRIVKIHQSVVGDPNGPRNHVRAIELEDGTLLSPVLSDMENEQPSVDFHVYKPKKAKP